MEEISVRELCAAVRGTLLQGDGNARIRSVNTDSRTVREGELFLPLVGERFDGHDYIVSALTRGAMGCLCKRVPDALPPEKCCIRVDDTLLALKDLAAWYRARFTLPVVQVTGSVGKTTTKEMIAAVLAEKFNTLKTAANFNNEIGTPQTLLGLLRTHEAAVIETGMDRAGQIRYLGEMVKPDIAVITNVGDAHIEYLGSRENILRAKCEIFENLKPDGIAVLCGDDALLNTVTPAQRTLRCGTGENCNVRVSDIIDCGIDGVKCTVLTEKARYALSIPAPGTHMIYSAAMAVAIGEALGETEEEIVRGIAAYEPAGSRMHVIRFDDGRRLLDDCYNANPQSMAASLRTLAASGGRTIAVLGDMAELGEVSEQAHRGIGKLTRELQIDAVFAIGDKAKYMTEENASAQWFPTIDAALPALRAAFASGGAMLVKASHSMHFEKIVEELTKA